MQPFNVFRLKGNWYRGNCHTHTTLSDGKSTAEEVVEGYRGAGYDFLVLTDHRRCQPTVAHLQRDGFLVMNGAELHPPTKRRGRVPHHIIGIGIDKAPSRARMEKSTARDVIRWIERHGGIAVYCHPYWSGHDVNHMMEGKSASAVEVFNSATEAMQAVGDSGPHWDQMLSLGIRWRGLAVDDMHRIPRDAYGGWIVVKAKRLTQKAILDAIGKGRFYSSSGPEIKSLALHRGEAHLECSPVRQVTWHTGAPRSRTQLAGKAPITSAVLDRRALSRSEIFLRVTLTDAQGRKAWSNPIFRNRKTGKWEE